SSLPLVIASAIASAIAPSALAEPATAQNCANNDVGVRPLDDLRTHDYLGSQGGLYPKGQNACPPEHQRDGIAIGREIVPLDAEGKPSEHGKIGVAAIGFSLGN